MDKRIYLKGVLRVGDQPLVPFDFWVNWWEDQPEEIGHQIMQLIRKAGYAYDKAHAKK